MIKGISKHNYHPPTPSQSIKLQTTSRDTWLPANFGSYASICWLLSGSELDNRQQIDEYELIATCGLADKWFFEATGYSWYSFQIEYSSYMQLAVWLLCVT